AFFKRTPLYLNLILIVMIVSSACIMFMKLQLAPPYFAHIAGWTALAAACIALVWTGAIVINDAWGRVVIPCPGPLLGKRRMN
ncbi:MAG: hypothetical protein LBT32_07760, partial [Peptococcaceae bacterium]|nr:hypothetical protein [Peptococcaceae bacterium]